MKERKKFHETSLSDTFIQEQLPSLSPHEITQLLLSLHSSHALFFPNIITMIEKLQDPHQLEAVGHFLSTELFIRILKAISDQQLPDNKLSPLLVGLSPLVFSQLLENTSLAYFKILKQESSLEPLQHHLLLFSYESEKNLQKNFQEIESLSLKIKELQEEDFTSQKLDAIYRQIEQKKEFYLTLLSRVDLALSLAWASNRTDLIEKLSQLKEKASFQLNHIIGYPKTDLTPDTGLFSFIKNSLSTKIGCGDPANALTALQDNDPTIEALTHFSIWYLKDYWELGLLPSIKKVEELDLPPGSIEKKQLHQQKLFAQVQENLTALGIGTIKQLKEKNIFSLHILKEYIFNTLQTKNGS